MAPPISAADQLIVALDFPDAGSALSLVERLDGIARWYKVGLELYIAEGNALLASLRARGYSVFLDLKLHDIPQTVASAVRSASRSGAEMLTVHACGGPEMLTASADAAGDRTRILAVTVLTSMDEPQLAAVGTTRSPAAQVELLAELAFAAGIRGFVASPQEVGSLRRHFGAEVTLVAPGIRPLSSDPGDQKRVGSPRSAIAEGANYLVVGRPITRAADPAAAAKAILMEMETTSG
jgi:orotidine-5'-phosphate decarboxylase